MFPTFQTPLSYYLEAAMVNTVCVSLEIKVSSLSLHFSNTRKHHTHKRESYFYQSMQKLSLLMILSDNSYKLEATEFCHFSGSFCSVLYSLQKGNHLKTYP